MTVSAGEQPNPRGRPSAARREFIRRALENTDATRVADTTGVLGGRTVQREVRHLSGPLDGDESVE